MPPFPPLPRAAGALLLCLALLSASGCDPQRLSELQPGVSTEADVRSRFGEPEQVWVASDGSRTFEYNRQPAGQVNYQITLGPDGRLTQVAQVLTPQTFAQVQPGMEEAAVRRLLGKPAKVQPVPLRGETHVTWRFVQEPGQSRAFTVVYGPDQRVLRTETGDDLDAPEYRGGR